MTPEEQALIRRWSQTLKHKVHATLVITDDARSADLDAFCTALAGFAPEFSFSQERAPAGTLPAILPSRRVRYHGVPLGRELQPFLAMLEHTAAEPLGSEVVAGQTTTSLKLYVAQQCPHCPGVLAGLRPLLAGDPGLELRVVDVTLFAELAEADGVRAVPTLIIDERWRLTGGVRLEDIEPLLTDPRRLGAGSLSRLLAQGNGDALVATMRERAAVLPALADVLSEPDFSLRLGGMALAEKLAEQDRMLAAELVEPLWERFTGATDPVRGDLLYLLGLVGQSNLLARLQTVVDGDYTDEVKEVAQEALEAVAER